MKLLYYYNLIKVFKNAREREIGCTKTEAGSNIYIPCPSPVTLPQSLANHPKFVVGLRPF